MLQRTGGAHLPLACFLPLSLSRGSVPGCRDLVDPDSVDLADSPGWKLCCPDFENCCTPGSSLGALAETREHCRHRQTDCGSGSPVAVVCDLAPSSLQPLLVPLLGSLLRVAVAAAKRNCFASSDAAVAVKIGSGSLLREGVGTCGGDGEGVGVSE